MFDEDAKLVFSRELLAWYRAHKRDLPWRRTRNPYHIWVSEVMLQQTRVETVKPYFERFVSLFPTVEALAEAPEETVLKAWEGLGYYSRARNLQAAAREVAERYGGEVPDAKERFAALKGVGPYTAGAVMSIAFNRREPAVDGNVMRVLSRYFCIEEDIAKGGTRAMMERLQYELIPEGEASDFNQAIMELGALVCTPKSPHCLTCPVMARCAGRLEGKEESLPIKTKAKPPRPEYRACAFVVDERGERVLLRRRPAEGLLADMWEPPHVEFGAAGWSPAQADADLGDALAGWLGEALGAAAVRPTGSAGTYEHTFSHIHWNVRVHRFTAAAAALAAEPPEPYRWVDRDGLARHPLPNVFVRMLKAEGFLA
ncbi:A/G-specific adenine glycosylase [Paenibacillus sp.]|uniref:A/G-specific adenine glycosylase n=1 Tax=Paenibacillus sp. TaxID=58172 RepID=UPI002D6623DB|nr:A/G-specific adenine glycosylase [Paenibacillus sp.]HZG55176.1 A/G-specific adenine glycosylase [Paenibacillus sp.]